MLFEIFKDLKEEKEAIDGTLNGMLLNELNKAKKKLNTPSHISLHEHDFKIDINTLLDEENECNEYIWVIRQCGTHLYSKSNLYSKSSQEFSDFNYFRGHDRLIYEVTVNKRDINRKKVYGEFKKVKSNEFTSSVLNKSNEHSQALCKVITKDNEVFIEKLNLDENFSDSKIFKENLNRNYDNIKKVYYLQYL